MPLTKRDQFLISMYNKTWENISRHILVVWQSVGVLTGAFAALVLADRSTIPLDYTASLVVLVGAWQVAHVLDASWWFNRNLLIVANIERQFLTKTDLRDIHPYFEKHRSPTMLDHHMIQLTFGIAITIVVLSFHFSKRIWPYLGTLPSAFELMMLLPYTVWIASGILLRKFSRRQSGRYERLRDTSPGKNMFAKPTRNK